MAWDDVISLVAGGASGYESRDRFDRETQAKEEIARLNAEIRAMTADLQSQDRRRGQDLLDSRYDRPSANTTAQQAGATERTNITNTGANQRNDADNKTVERGQDLTDGRYWDTADRAWSGLFMGDETRRRGQDIGAGTAARGQDLAHTDRSRASDIDAYGRELQRQKDELDTSGLFGGTKRTIQPMNKWLESDPAPAPPAAAPRPTAPAARPAAPVAARPSAAAPGAAEAQATALVKQIRDLEAAGKNATAQRQQLATLRAGVQR